MTTPHSRPIRHALLAASLGAVALAPAAAHAQPAASISTSTNRAINLPYSSTSVPGCAQGAYGTGVQTSTNVCNVSAMVGGGSAVGTATGTFDPAAGTIKGGASIAATNYTLSQFVPQYDQNGVRILDGSFRNDMLQASSWLTMLDQYSFGSVPGANPATMSMTFDWTGTMRADFQSSGALTYASSLINVCNGAIGACTGVPGVPQYGNGAYVSLDGNGTEQFSLFTFATQPSPITMTFSGTHAPGSVNGTLTIAGIPVAAAGTYDFAFFLVNDAYIFHSTSGYGNTPYTCDPTDPYCVDPPFTAVADEDVTGTAEADFTHTITFRGYNVYDANGVDITRLAPVTFAGGFTPAAPGIVTPEPATIALLGGGLLALGAVARRKRTA